MGLASEALTQRALLHSNRVELEHQFNDDVDNVLKVKPLRHMINAEVGAWDVSSDGSESDFVSVGIVQFINKSQNSSYNYITSSDLVTAFI